MPRTLLSLVVLLLAGWERFTPERSIVSVEFPAQPTVEHDRAVVEEYFELEQTRYVSRPSDGTIYILQLQDVPSDLRATISPDEYMERVAFGPPEKQNLRERTATRGTFAGQPSLDVVGIDGHGMKLETHMIAVGPVLVSVAVKWAAEAPRPKDAERFFDSVKLLDHPEWDLGPDAPKKDWQERVSPLGFRVKVRGEPHVTPFPDGQGEGLFALDGVGNLYRVMVLVRWPEAADGGIDKWLTEVAQLEGETRSEVEFAGGKGVSARGHSGGMQTEVRLRSDERWLYAAIVSTPIRRPGHADADAFFDSFTVSGSPAKAMPVKPAPARRSGRHADPEQVAGQIGYWVGRVLVGIAALAGIAALWRRLRR